MWLKMTPEEIKQEKYDEYSRDAEGENRSQFIDEVLDNASNVYLNEIIDIIREDSMTKEEMIFFIKENMEEGDLLDYLGYEI